MKGMEDTSPRVRSFAAQAVAKLAGPGAFEGIIQLLRERNGNDRALQHVGALASAKSACINQRVAASKDSSPAVRRATVVAFRMRGEAQIAPLLQDADPLVVLEAAQDYDGGRAFHTALGHLPATYNDATFPHHVYGGIYWAAQPGTASKRSKHRSALPDWLTDNVLVSETVGNSK